MKPLKSKSLVLDIYGAFVRDLGGWIAVADLVELLGQLGVEEQLARSSVSRFTRKGLLERRRIDGRVGYALTPAARRNLEHGDERVFSRLSRARLDEGWVLVTFSIPERARSARHQLRSRLTWLGFGNLGGGLWIAPQRVHDRCRDAIVSLGLEEHVDLFEAHYRAFSDPRALVARCWDLDGMRTAYQRFTAGFGHLAQRANTTTGDTVTDFVDYVTMLHSWRTLPYDPGIPRALLPDDWEGADAAELFSQARSRLEPGARRHVVRVVSATANAA